MSYKHHRNFVKFFSFSEGNEKTRSPPSVPHLPVSNRIQKTENEWNEFVVFNSSFATVRPQNFRTATIPKTLWEKPKNYFGEKSMEKWACCTFVIVVAVVEMFSISVHWPSRGGQPYPSRNIFFVQIYSAIIVIFAFEKNGAWMICDGRKRRATHKNG